MNLLVQIALFKYFLTIRLKSPIFSIINRNGTQKL